MRFAFALLAGLNCALAFPVFADETSGTAAEPIRYMGNDAPDLSFHDGRLRPAVGVHNIQVMRANRSHPDADGADGFGWTYSHAPMLAYWNGKFYLEYLSNLIGEHKPPGQTLLVESPDGFRWSRPRVVFPPFKISDEAGLSVSHQRMGFYVAPNGRLLALSFYGIAPGVNDGGGVGRAVREIHKDGSPGPIYFIRYNRHAGSNETNSPYAFYKTSTDTGFVAACDALLANKLMTQQWWEEDRGTDGFFALAGNTNGFDAKALSFFHRKDGAVVGLWKKRWAALSFNEGKSWTEPVQLPTVIHQNAKAWGQRTDDGRYAVVYNPAERYRWPLAVITGDDGVLFDDMLMIHGDFPYPRYSGKFKNLGPQYVRGIVEGNGNPPGPNLWLAYSINKEDIWVARVPVPIRGVVDKPVNDNFDDQPVGPAVRDWNIYSPLWAPVSLVKSPDGQPGHCLELRDEDRYDYAKAERVFPESDRVTLRFRVRAGQRQGDDLEIEVLDPRGCRPVRLVLGQVVPATTNRWYAFELRVDAKAGEFDVAVDGKPVLSRAKFAEAAGSLQRLRFRTGPFRNFDAKEADALVKELKLGDRLEGDEKALASVFYVDDVQTMPQGSAFPTAEGAGAMTPGGRGGKVIEVTTLDDSGPGSLREALETSGPRVVVFRVSGIIALNSPLSIDHPFVTVAGQTAPGDGICIRGETTQINTHDVVLRHLRFRRGPAERRDDALGGYPIRNVIVDHCSASWGLDENLSLYRWTEKLPGGKTRKRPVENLTIQWCISSEALNPHNHAFGGTWGGRNVSFHHNLFACNTGRNPSIGYGDHVDYRNNVVFNWRHRTMDGGDGSSWVNVVANYYKPGPAVNKGNVQFRICKPQHLKMFSEAPTPGKWSVAGNVVAGNAKVTADNWDGGVQFDDEDIKEFGGIPALIERVRASEPFAAPPIAQQTAEKAYELVLASAGATRPKRDAVDTRIIEQVRTGAAKFGDNGIIISPDDVGGWPEYKSAPAPLDSDRDGMPDDWEKRTGLNPKDPGDAAADRDGDGYTNIEEYLGWLVGEFPDPVASSRSP